MLTRMRKYTLMLALLACSLVVVSAHAQTATTAGGYLGLSLNAPTYNQLASAGVGLTFGPNQQFLNGFPIYNINGGLIDMPSSQGELGTEGGLIFGNGTSQWSVRRLTLDTTGPVATITGLFTINGVPMGRQPLFELQVATPFPGQSLGTTTYDRVPVTLRASVRTMLNSSFGTSLVAGTTDAYLYIKVTLVKDAGTQ